MLKPVCEEMIDEGAPSTHKNRVLASALAQRRKSRPGR